MAEVAALPVMPPAKAAIHTHLSNHTEQSKVSLSFFSRIVIPLQFRTVAAMAIIIQFFLQLPVFQFFMAILCISAGKLMEKWADAVAKHLPHIQCAMAVVAVVQLIMLVNNSLQYLESIASNMPGVANTSWRRATRANLIERRSCLAFSAKWHKCSVQGAHVLCQKNSRVCQLARGCSWRMVSPCLSLISSWLLSG